MMHHPNCNSEESVSSKQNTDHNSHCTALNEDVFSSKSVILSAYQGWGQHIEACIAP